MARFRNVERGLYRETTTGVYYERMTATGKDTFNSLRTTKLAAARKAIQTRRLARAGAEMGLTISPDRANSVTVGDVIRNYEKDGYPDRDKAKRPEATRKAEETACEILVEFWNKIPVEAVTLKTCDHYFDWRLARLTRGTGERTVDLELNTLNNAMTWGMRDELIRVNPLYGRIRYRQEKRIAHCRTFMPRNSEELHQIAARFFAHPASEPLGWQLLFEAYTGLRTEEALGLQTGTQDREPGWVTPDGRYLCVRRAKNQEMANPFATNNPGLEATLAAWRRWKDRRFPDSPWYFPSAHTPGQPLNKSALAHGLLRLQRSKKRKRGKAIPPTLDHKVTSHGLRAFYVTMRRSHGVLDSQIAFEIGHTSGGQTLARVYGGVPPAWLEGKAPKFDWLPAKSPAAWSQFEWEQNEETGQMENRQQGGQVALGGEKGPATSNSELVGA